MSISQRQPNEQHFASWDDSELFYRHWPATQADRRHQAVILFHGGHEHSGRFQELVDRLEQPCHVFAWDARAHGRSPGKRGYARHFMDFVRDADVFVRHIEAVHGIQLEDMAILGHSVGSVIAATWVHDFAPPVRAMVLGSPAFDVKLYVPFARPALRLIQRLRPDAFVNSYVKPGMLTHDKEEAAARRDDPLIAPPIAVRVLNSLYETADRVLAGAASIQTPTLLLSAGSDRVVHQGAQQAFFDALGSRDKAMHVLPGFYHEVFHEKARDIPIELAGAFLSRHMRTEVTIDSGVMEANRERFGELDTPLPLWNPKRHLYSVMRLAIRGLGRLSRGMRIGGEHGFDSGPMLDYVYRNQAQGLGPLGRLIDRNYLDSAGWRGIRQRRRHMQQALNTAIDTLPDAAPVHVVDLAAGPGRYLLDVLTQRKADAERLWVTCRDRDEQGLTEGRELARGMGIQNIRYETGDAFSAESIAAIEPSPDVVVVSGLYELFADNRQVLDSLRAIRATLPAHGQLIVTNQPSHPQLELIARTLPNRDGVPWVMRPRSAAEMAALLRQAGFRPTQMLSDDDGVFTVTRAAIADPVVRREQAA